MYKRSLRFMWLLVLFSLFGFGGWKFSAAADAAVVVRSVGLLDADGSVLYSVVLATGTEGLGELTITSTLPENTTLVEIVAAPPDAVATDDGTSVTWQVAALDADTLLGPFTYRVKLDDDTAEAPLNVAATVNWTQPTAGTAEALLEAGVLKPLAESGTITIDAQGTLNADGENDVVTVGDTGIQLFIPAGAVTEATTLTLTRQAIDESSTPADVVDYWWCASVVITSDPEVEFSLPISLSLPTRRTLTPGMAANFFIRGEDEQWELVGAAQGKSRHIKPTFQRYLTEIRGAITPDGNGIMVIAVSNVNLNNVQITGGVNINDRKTATVAGVNLPTRQITDGTSNTALPYIEQDNIISHLVGKP